jgi:hypothetical protein
MNTVKELRQAGYQVFVRHGRPTDELNKHFLPKGGMTLVTIQKGDDVFTGSATCSDHDPYNRKLGLTIALGRALKQQSRATS